ncbi:unnamed protein product [Protopolystoma xenopodis]|uniref:Uncharacterized protein n=1 Tax=Protopolystoma xenopodis TaxID=117903 RepID=A0A3S5ABC7_9PLAT|nr:unnamed protein product [Protopolystoma xenopodis]
MKSWNWRTPFETTCPLSTFVSCTEARKEGCCASSIEGRLTIVADRRCQLRPTLLPSLNRLLIASESETDLPDSSNDAGQNSKNMFASCKVNLC